MDNAVGPGNTVRYTNNTSSAIAANDVVVIGVHIGIAPSDIAVGAEGILCTEGEYELAATSAETWSLGDQLYWNATTEKLTTEASLTTPAGMATEDKAAGVTASNVKINA